MTTLDFELEPGGECDNIDNLPDGGVVFAYGFPGSSQRGAKLYRLESDESLTLILETTDVVNPPMETNVINDVVVDPKGRGYFLACGYELILVGHDGEVMRRVRLEGAIFGLAAKPDGEICFNRFTYGINKSELFTIHSDAMVSAGDPTTCIRNISDAEELYAGWNDGENKIASKMCFDETGSSLIVLERYLNEVLGVSMVTHEVSLFLECYSPTHLAMASDGTMYIICCGTEDDDDDDACLHELVKTDQFYTMTLMEVPFPSCQGLALDERRGLLYVVSQRRLHTIAVPTYAERREQLIWPVFRLFALASLGHARLTEPLPPLYRTEAVYRRLVRLPRCLVHRVLCYAVPNVSI